MGCCGNKRAAQAASRAGAAPGAVEDPAPPVARRAVAPVNFRYTGPTALTVQGPLTGRRYRFEMPGAVVAVDARDAASVAAVPGLRRIVR